MLFCFINTSLEQILPFHKDQILRLRTSYLGVPDELVWLKNTTGSYSTKSGYLAISTETTSATPSEPVATQDWYASVWNVKASQKVKLFLWKSLHKALHVGEKFAIRNIPISSLCARCNAEETVAHVLFHCPYASQVWSLASTSENSGCSLRITGFS